MSRLPRFVAAGEALTDLIRVGPDLWRSRVGGAGFNVARTMARLGLPSAFAGAVSRDVLGQALMEAAGQAGLDLRFMQQASKSPLLAVVAQAQPPDYFFIGDDSADLHFSAQQLPEGWMSAVACVHFGGISLARPPLAGHLLELARALRSHGVLISFDPNYRRLMGPAYEDVFWQMVRLADVIKVSDEDLSGLFPRLDAQAALAGLLQARPAASILFTSGPHGAEYLHAGQVWRAPAPAVTVVDTIGAGDACISALLHCRLELPQAGAAEQLRRAVAAGTAACLQEGATPPALAQVLEIAPQVAVSGPG